MLDLPIARVNLFRLHDTDFVTVGIDAITTGPKSPPQDALALGLAEIAIHQELAARQIFAQFAGDDRQLARFHYHIVHNRSLPPNGTVKMPSGTRHFFLHADFPIDGKMTGNRILIGPSK
jgi:hypothetical protein